MHLATLLDQADVFIGYDAHNQWLYVEWKGEHTPASSRAVCLLMLESLRARPCAKILNDNSGITRTTVKLTHWSTEWLAQMQQAGLQYIAWVYAPVFPARQHTEMLVQRIGRPTVATFDELASAYRWLQLQRAQALDKQSETLASCCEQKDVWPSQQEWFAVAD